MENIPKAYALSVRQTTGLYFDGKKYLLQPRL